MAYRPIPVNHWFNWWAVSGSNRRPTD